VRGETSWVHPFPYLPRLYLRGVFGKTRVDPVWYRHFHYASEAARGYDAEGSYSPDGQWLAVQASTAVDGVQRPVVLYPLHGRGPVMALCASCFVSWLPAGHGLQIRFGSVSDADERRTYVVPIPAGELLPAVFTGNRLVSESEVARAPGVRVVSRGFASLGPDPDTFVYTKTTVHRNLFRIPLD